MTMWISKNLGGGFRIGTTIRTEPTQAELRRMEKYEFIKRAEKRMEAALEKYSMQSGYYITENNERQIYNMDEETLGKIEPYVKNFGDVLRLINDGGKLTEKRKEILLRAIYGVEELLSRENELSNLKCRLEKVYRFSVFCFPFFSGVSYIIIHNIFLIGAKEKSILWFSANILIFIACVWLKKLKLNAIINLIREKSRCPIRENVLRGDITLINLIMGMISFFLLYSSFMNVFGEN